MKSLQRKTAVLIALLAIFALSTDGYAQRGRGNGMGMQNANRGYNQADFRGVGNGYGAGYLCSSIPDLTEEQTEKIEALRLKHFSEQQQFHNKMGELRARRRTLCSSNAPLSELNDNSDAITALQNKMMRNRDSHRKEIRGLLTSEQQVYFDAHSGYGRMGRGFHKNRQGRGMGMRSERGGGYRNW